MNESTSHSQNSKNVNYRQASVTSPVSTILETNAESPRQRVVTAFQTRQLIQLRFTPRVVRPSQAAKRASEWIPLCHPLALEHVEIVFEQIAADLLEVRCSVACSGPTGVEMEALVGASAAALTVYDMTKALSAGIALERVELLEKAGGRSGTWRREDGAA